MSYSTLIDWDHSLNEWIKDGFPKWFVENIVIPEDIEEDKAKEKKENNNNNNNNNNKKKRTYKPPGRSYIDYWETPWGLLLRNPNVGNINSKEGKLFRRRFRVPFEVFNDLLFLTNKFNLFDIKMDYKVTIPVELKLMGILRILGI
jgi:hypothetical protein